MATANPKAKRKKKADSVVKLRIRVSAYENKLLDKIVRQIVDTALRNEATVRGPVPLPNIIKKYTVNRATFVYKDSREQFEIRVHRRLIDIVNPSPKLIDSLSNMNLPSGVDINISMI